jgi:AraC-like DNA-binding protein
MQMMLIEALRAQLAVSAPAATGWFAALRDRQIGSVLQRMHADPSHPWTLDSLALAAGMSRSSFAARFKTTVGFAPIDYLLRWRIRLASTAAGQHGLRLVDRPVAWLCIRKRLQHRVQTRHGPIASSISKVRASSG